MINDFEAKIVEGVQRVFSAKFWEDFFLKVTILSELRALFIIILFIFIFFGLKSTARYVFILIATTVSGMLIKLITQRPRPFALIEFTIQMKASQTPSDYSFVSNHTLAAAITALYLFFTVRRILKSLQVTRPRKVDLAIKITTAIVLGFATLLIGFSRIYLGVHYLSDVLFAIMLSFLFYYIYSFIYDKYIAESNGLKYMYLLGALVFTVTVFWLALGNLYKIELVAYAALSASTAATFFIKPDTKINFANRGKTITFAVSITVFVLLGLINFDALNPLIFACGVIFFIHLIYGVILFILLPRISFQIKHKE